MSVGASGTCASSRATCSRRPPAFLPPPTRLPLADSSVSLGNAVNRSLAEALGGQLTVGGVIGFATGYAVKRVGQLILVIMGCEVVVLQLFAQRGWVIVNWNRIGKDLSPHVEKEGFDRVVEALKFKVPFAGAFSAGCYAGFRWT